MSGPVISPLRRAAIGLVICVSYLSPAAADTTVESVSYGVIEATAPTEISSGVLGLSKRAGIAYTLRFANGSSLQVKSPSIDLRIGDCVAMAGTGKDATLSRARPQPVSRQRSQGLGPWLVAARPIRIDECGVQASARRRCRAGRRGSVAAAALLRELLVCDQPGSPAPGLDELSGPVSARLGCSGGHALRPGAAPGAARGRQGLLSRRVENREAQPRVHSTRSA